MASRPEIAVEEARAEALRGVDRFAGELTAIARDIYAHPEVGFHEHRTAGVVAGALEGMGLEARTGIARTGVKAGDGFAVGADQVHSFV